MTKIQLARIWAFIMLGTAVALHFGAIENDMATTLMIVMPALAWLSIRRVRSDACRVGGA